MKRAQCVKGVRVATHAFHPILLILLHSVLLPRLASLSLCDGPFILCDAMATVTEAEIKRLFRKFKKLDTDKSGKHAK